MKTIRDPETGLGDMVPDTDPAKRKVYTHPFTWVLGPMPGSAAQTVVIITTPTAGETLYCTRGKRLTCITRVGLGDGEPREDMILTRVDRLPALPSVPMEGSR